MLFRYPLFILSRRGNEYAKNQAHGKAYENEEGSGDTDIPEEEINNDHFGILQDKNDQQYCKKDDDKDFGFHGI